MEEETILVFGKHPEEKTLMTDAALWGNIMTMRATSERAYSKELQKMLTRVENYLETEAGEKKEEHRRDVEVYETAVKKQLSLSGHDGAVYEQCAEAIESLLQNGDSAVLEENRKTFLSLMSDYELQKRVIDLKKQRYLKRCADLERDEIKKLFTPEDETIKEKFQHSKSKAEKATIKYEKSLAEAEMILENIKKVSAKYEEDWKTMEEKNCKTLMELVTKSVEDSHSGKFCARDISFSHVDIPQLIEKQVVKREVIKPAFCKYKETEDKEDLLAQILAEGEIAVNVASARRRTAIILIGFKKEASNHLTIKAGGKLKQILPANEDGFAYGVYKESKLSKARKGFFPAANVRLLD